MVTNAAEPPQARGQQRMDYAADIAAEEAHMRKLARIPGWQPYIEEKAKRMAKWQPAMYGHLPQVVSETIREGRAAC